MTPESMNAAIALYLDLPKPKNWAGCLNLCFELEEYLISLGGNKWNNYMAEINLVGHDIHCRPGGKTKAFLKTVGKWVD